MIVKDFPHPRGSRRRVSVPLRRSTILAEGSDGGADRPNDLDPFICSCFSAGKTDPSMSRGGRSLSSNRGRWVSQRCGGSSAQYEVWSAAVVFQP